MVTETRPKNKQIKERKTKQEQERETHTHKQADRQTETERKGQNGRKRQTGKDSSETQTDRMCTNTEAETELQFRIPEASSHSPVPCMTGSQKSKQWQYTCRASTWNTCLRLRVVHMVKRTVTCGKWTSVTTWPPPGSTYNINFARLRQARYFTRLRQSRAFTTLVQCWIARTVSHTAAARHWGSLTWGVWVTWAGRVTCGVWVTWESGSRRVGVGWGCPDHLGSVSHLGVRITKGGGGVGVSGSLGECEWQ